MQKELHLLPKTEQVLLLIDWENLWYSLMSRFGIKETHLSQRISGLLRWIKRDVGELIGGHGYVFAPEHLSAIHQQICLSQGLRMITCPKLELSTPRENPKSGEKETRVDTVDQTIIEFAREMIGHPKFKTICLVSGDKDYIPLLEELRKKGVKIALAPPTIDSLSRDKKLIGLVDNNLLGKRMLFTLDRIQV